MQATGTVDKANPSLKLAPSPFNCVTIAKFSSRNMGLSRALRGPVVLAILTARRGGPRRTTGPRARCRAWGCLAPRPEL